MKTTVKYKLQAFADNARKLGRQALNKPVSSVLSLCVVAGIAATIASFSQTSEPTVAVTPTAQTMPVARTLTSADGRTIDVVITAKTPTAIMVKKADGKEFEIAFDKLSDADKAFVAGLIEAPFKKMRVLIIGDIRHLTERMKPTEFEIAEVHETDALKKITDQELEAFDAIVVTREGCSRKWSTNPGNTPIEKGTDAYIQRDRILRLTDQGKVVAWRSYYKIDKKKLISTKQQPAELTPKHEYEHEEPFLDVQGNTIFFSWTSKINGRSYSRKIVESENYVHHFEFIDQTLMELKRLIKKERQ